MLWRLVPGGRTERWQFFFCSLSLVVSELFCNFAASKAFPLLTPAPSSVSAFAILLLSGRAFFAKSLVVSEFCCTFAAEMLGLLSTISSRPGMAVALKREFSRGTTVPGLSKLLLLARAIQFVFCDSTVAAFFFLSLCHLDRRWRIYEGCCSMGGTLSITDYLTYGRSPLLPMPEYKVSLLNYKELLIFCTCL